MATAKGLRIEKIYLAVPEKGWYLRAAVEYPDIVIEIDFPQVNHKSVNHVLEHIISKSAIEIGRLSYDPRDDEYNIDLGSDDLRLSFPRTSFVDALLKALEGDSEAEGKGAT